MEKNRPVIIFDFGGILGEVSRMRVIKYIGAATMMRYVCATGFSPSRLTTSLYSLVANTRFIRGNYCRMKDPYGSVLPGVIVDWQCGLVSPAWLLQEMYALIECHCEGIEKKALLRMVDCLYNPQKMVDMVIIYKKMFDFVRELKEAGYRTCLLSNFDPDTFGFLQEKYRSYFDLFDDMIISGRVGWVKPDHTMFRSIIDKYKGPFMFIDDQEENCCAAREVGIMAIHCPATQNYIFGTGPDYAKIKSACLAQLGKKSI